MCIRDRNITSLKTYQPESHVDSQNLLDIVSGEFISVIRVDDLVTFVKDLLIIKTKHTIQAQQTIRSAATNLDLFPLSKCFQLKQHETDL